MIARVEEVNAGETEQVRKRMLKWLCTKVIWGGLEASVFIKGFNYLAKELEDIRRS